jgi:methionyl-tRNA formyltransferase
LRALFFGTPEIAVASLDALTQVAQVVGVVTQPDRPSGRGMQLHAPPVKQRALQLGLEVHQPTKVRTGELASWVVSKQVDVALVLAYGRILPQPVLDAPRHGCMNLHASILPKYRGASPIIWAIVQGETETGVSLMQMDAGMDTGAVYVVRKVGIGADETAGELSVKLAELSARIVREDLAAAVEGRLAAVAQDEAAATRAPILSKEQGAIDWRQDAGLIHNHVRGMQPWPGAFTRLSGKTLKVLGTRVRDAGTDTGKLRMSMAPEPGVVLVADTGGVVVACGRGLIEVTTLQAEGRKAMGAREFVAGRGLKAGDRLGA